MKREGKITALFLTSRRLVDRAFGLSVTVLTLRWAVAFGLIGYYLLIARDSSLMGVLVRFFGIGLGVVVAPDDYEYLSRPVFGRILYHICTALFALVPVAFAAGAFATSILEITLPNEARFLCALCGVGFFYFAHRIILIRQDRMGP